jgi:hypothetical protein
MSFKQMPIINTAVRSIIYNDTTYCMHSLIRDNALEHCRQIPNADLNERVVHILWQVNIENLKDINYCQGVKVNVTPYFIENGFRLPNGTWTGSLGTIQRGEYDGWGTYASINIDRISDFAMTQPYSFQSYGFLMKRVQTFDINFDAVSAGFSYQVFILLFAALFCLFAMFLANEKRHFVQKYGTRNSVWTLISALIPGDNTQEIIYQSGITRKCLILTSNFTLLMIGVHYGSYLLPKILIPERPPIITVGDIAEMVKSGKSSLVFRSSSVNGGFETTLMSSKHGSIAKLADALRINGPIREPYITKIYDLVDNENGIMFATLSAIHERLNALKPELCGQYAIVELTDLPPTMLSLIFNKNRKVIVEAMNVIVSERMDFIQKIFESFELNEECRNYIFPKNSFTYKSLQLRSLTGALTLLAAMMIIGLIICILEFGMFQFSTKEKTEDTNNIILHLHIDLSTVDSSKHSLLLQKYGEILKELSYTI